MGLNFKITPFFVFLFFTTQAQTSKLELYAPDYLGEKVYVWQETNTISGSRELVLEEEIKDSSFSFEIDTEQIRRYFIGIDFQIASIYIQPGMSYKAFFPPYDGEELRSISWNAKTSLVLIDTDSTDINLRIERFETEFSAFFKELMQENDTGRYVPFSAREVLASFQAYRSTWKKDSIKYIDDYKHYIAALTEFQLGAKRSDIFEKYLIGSALLPLNVAYGDFFNAYYQNYFDFYELFPMSSRFDSAYSSPDPYQALSILLSEDVLLPDAKIQGAVLIKGLYDLYNKGVKRDSTSLMILDVVADNNRFEVNASLAKHYLKNLQQGHGSFPNFLCYTQTDTLELNSFLQEGLNYIIVYGSWSSSAKAEMELMLQYKKEYREQVNMIYISIDEKFSSYASFIKAHREMAYANVWVGMHPEVLENLGVYDVPRFYIVDGSGEIKQWNALSPSKGVEEVFYSLKMEEEKKRKESFLKDQPNNSTKDK